MTTRWNRAALLIAAALSASALAGARADQLPCPPESRTDLLGQLKDWQQATARWKAHGPKRYRYDIQFQSESNDNIVRVEVHDLLTPVARPLSGYAYPPEPPTGRTVEELFQQIRTDILQSRGSACTQFGAEYDPVYGYPTAYGSHTAYITDVDDWGKIFNFEPLP